MLRWAKQRNAGRTALRAPAGGKLQGAAAHRNPGENAAAALVSEATVCITSCRFDISAPAAADPHQQMCIYSASSGVNCITILASYGY